MTKFIAIIAALLQIVPATRTISGEVYRIDYPTGTQDAPIVTIVTEDGDEWITDDYIAPRHIAVIAGNSYEYGEDAGEVIISDPVVISIIA
jgi:hypothetical protein